MNNDLISRSDLKKAIDKEFEKADLSDYEACSCVCEIYDKCIDNAPIVAEISTNDIEYKAYCRGLEDGKKIARPQGEWIEGENGNIKCNKCGCEIRYSYLIGNKPDFPKFCCDCGTKMKGGEENEHL